jgi:predicted nucleic acid-binding protein
MPNSSTVCCDANLIAYWVIADGLQASELPFDRLLRTRAPLIAPSLFHYEVANVLFRTHRAKQAPFERVQEGFRTVLSLPIALFDDDALHLEALAIANRFNLPAVYHAHYLALALRENCDFWTSDKRLFNTIGNHLSWVRFADLDQPTPE